MVEMIIQEPVQATIWFILNHYSYKDAIFLAERLNAEVASEESLYLLATCYYRAGKQVAAYSILSNKSFKSSECRLLLARCCCDLKKYGEAEEALLGKFNCLEKSGSCKGGLSSEDIIQEFGKSAAFAAQMLALICSKTERYEKAVDYYLKSLKFNPFLWSSFENLVKLGAKPDSSKIFNINNIDFSLCHGNNPLVTLWNSNVKGSFDNTSQGTGGSQVTVPIIKELNQPVEIHSPFALIKPTNDNGTIDVITPESNSWVTTCLAPQKAQPLTKITRRSANVSSERISPTTVKRAETPSGTASRLSFGVFPLIDSTPPIHLCTLGPNENIDTSEIRNANMQSERITRAPAKKPQTRRSHAIQGVTTRNNQKEMELNELNKAEPIKSNQQSGFISEEVKQAGLKMQRASAEGLLNLLVDLANASLCLGQFHCTKAIKILMNLPQKQFNTGWVLSGIGRAYFEMSKYEEAVKYFEEAHKVEPHRLQGTEYYSTALWHLQREIKLSMLAQECIEFDKNAPQTWCVAGNCFGLQKEHETAIKFLQRAIQVDPDFAYAYTLLGHELVLTEEMDHAMACFRNAIRIDARHYNAWYGIGMIYYKQEKFQLAELHYRKALSISSCSPVLLCHIGVVQNALKKTESALTTLNKAIEMDPKNALCKFHRASIYFSMEKHQLALHELEELKQIVPKESLVYFLIGKVHKRLGNTHLALMNFSWAMDLDPKGANNQIKEVIDKQYANDDDEVVVCLDSGDETYNSNLVNESSESSLRPRSHLHRESHSSSMEDEDDDDADEDYVPNNDLNNDGGELMDEGV
ncbi:cell division cycle protein 27 homolog isoform X2 [Panonychus citri]|uniref:cell division cycle protein 27 homolog isoform X2 n=1 Tax=Panonychus citri TaxID=50023 RepID=UPI002307371D|nr:cell division cycle protein 27 homolog isoform X2 [Panonychus citri]